MNTNDRQHLLDEMTVRRPTGEDRSARVHRKAAAIRRALIEGGVVVSPDRDTLFKDLPYSRQSKWLAIAETYVNQVG